MKRIFALLLVMMLVLPMGAEGAFQNKVLREHYEKMQSGGDLAITDDSNGQWKNRSGNKLDFRIRLTNTSKKKTVKAFELYFYIVDVFGDRLMDGYYYDTTTKKINPEKSAYCDYIRLPYRNEISRVYCGIKRIVYTDDTIVTYDTVNFRYWDI